MRWPRWFALGAFLLALAMLAGTVWLLVGYRTGAHTAGNFAGLGAVALQVGRIGQLEAAREVIRGAPGAVVVDVRIDPAIALPRLDRVAAMAPGVTDR